MWLDTHFFISTRILYDIAKFGLKPFFTVGNIEKFEKLLLLLRFLAFLLQKREISPFQGLSLFNTKRLGYLEKNPANSAHCEKIITPIYKAYLQFL